MKKIAFVFWLLLLFACFCEALATPFRYLKPENGLPSGEINHIVQDQQGLIWMATWSGLVCYDGYQFKHYRPILGDHNSLPDKKVKKLHVDKMGSLWVVTDKNLIRYQYRTCRFETFSFDRVSNEPINILHLSEISGHLVIHAVEGFYIVPVDVVHRDDFRISKIKLLEGNTQIFNYIHYSTALTTTQMVCVSNTGPMNSAQVFIMELDSAQADIVLKQVQSTTLQAEIRHICGNLHDSIFYFSTSKGLYQYNNEKNFVSEEVLFRGIPLNICWYGSNKRLYAAGNKSVLFYFDLLKGQPGQYVANPYQSEALISSNIHTLFEDFSGNLWVGHQGQGISLLNLYQKDFITIRKDPFQPKPLSSNAVMCFNSSIDYLLVGCRTGGINIVRKEEIEKEQVNFEVLSVADIPGYENYQTGIWDIARQNDSLFWVGGDAGLFELSRRNARWQLKPFSDEQVFQNMIRKIVIDRHNNLWVGTQSFGLVFIPDPQTNIEKNFFQYLHAKDDTTTISDNLVQAITIDRNDRFWVGTVNGLNLLDGFYHELDVSGNQPPNLVFKRMESEVQAGNWLNNNEINQIFDNIDGKLWIATQGGGINIYNPYNQQFSYFSTINGLPGHDVMGIVQDNIGNLWISTEKGLVYYDQNSKEPSVTVYNSWNGIQGDIFMVNSYHKTDESWLFFGGENGFTGFKPMKIKPNIIMPKTVFTALRVANHDIGIGDTLNKRVLLKQALTETGRIVLPYDQNSFSVGVAAIHFQYPQGNRIAYMLDNYHKEWQYMMASERFIHITRLPAGDYTLRVYAISSDHVSDTNILTLKIRILKPWYRSWYINSLLLIVGLALITLGIIFIINRQRQIYIQRLYDLTIENNESKMMFLANIAHELRTPLSLVISPIEDMIINRNDVDTKWHNHLKLIHRNSNYLLKLIDQIIDFRRLDAGKLKLSKRNEELVSLVKNVVANFKAFETKKNVKLNLNLPDDAVICRIDSQKIEEVLYNLLSNAFKHTQSGCSIEVSLIVEPDLIVVGGSGIITNVRLSVFNEGKDISDEDKSKVFERFFKADDSLDGAGIGLSFAKSLVEMHHGKIWVESVLGRGVVFHVSLPLEKAEALEDDIAQKDKIDSDTEKDKLSGKKLLYDFQPDPADTNKSTKILIVEDNDDLRRFLNDILARTYTCYEASDGEAGYKRALEIIPDIIISDVIMPKLDGYALVKKIKDDIKTCHIPVIMLTAKNSNENIITGYKSGVDAYVTKPFDTNVILSQIHRLIKNRELIHERYKKQHFMVEVAPQVSSRDDEFFNTVRTLLDKNLSNPDFNVKELSDEMQMSTTQLYRKIKSLTNYSPVEFLRITRLHKAHDLLAQQKYSIKEVCYQTGFNNLSYFVKCFREYFGVTPANYRDKGALG